jgi:P pilus assembly chaperone PapD
MIVRIIFLAFCAVGILNAQAQAQVFLEQAKVSLTVSGGEHQNGSFLVHNTSSNPISVKVYWEDFKYKAPYDGTKIFLPAGTAPGSASQWVTFSPQIFTMPGFGQQRIDYSVSAPSQVEEGHYGVLFFESSAVTKVNSDNVSLVTRLGCLFFIEPSNKNKNAVLQDIQLKANSITASFVNQGNVVLIPRTTYYIMQDGGMVLSRGESKKLYVPPGASGTLEIPLKKKLDQGQYTLVVNSDLEEGDVVVKEIGLAVDAAGQLTIENSKD